MNKLMAEVATSENRYQYKATNSTEHNKRYESIWT